MSENGRHSFAEVPSPLEVQWRRTLDRWKASELGPRDFCRRENVSEPQFHYWRRKIRRRKEPAAITPTPKAPRPAPVRFVPLHVAPSAAPFEILLAGGRIVRVPCAFDPATLRRLVEALEGRPC